MKSKSCVNLSFSVCSLIQHNSLILQFFLITFEYSSLTIAFSCNRHRHPEARKKDDQRKKCIANKTTVYPVHKNLSNFTELNKGDILHTERNVFGIQFHFLIYITKYFNIDFCQEIFQFAYIYRFRFSYQSQRHFRESAK